MAVAAIVPGIVADKNSLKQGIASSPQGDAWQSDLRYTTSGDIRKCLTNIQIVLKNDAVLKDLLAYDDVNQVIIKLRDVARLNLREGDWEPTDDAAIRAYIDEEYSVTFSKTDLGDMIESIARLHRFNPLRQRIEQVAWDGVPRAERYFINYLGAENNHYTRTITRKWLLGAITRIYQPGCKFEMVPVLQGPQGIGKSTVARLLAPDYFNDSLTSLGKHKDDYQQMVGSWIIEISELSAMKATELENVKRFVSSQEDRYRESYAVRSTIHKRTSVLIGSTNESEFLTDSSGNRRFFPIPCAVNKPSKSPFLVKDCEILQILAEVKTWYDVGENLILDQKTQDEAKFYQNQAQVTDVLKELLDAYTSMRVPGNWENMSLNYRRQFFKKVIESKGLENNGNSGHLIMKTSTREILAVVLERNTEERLSGRNNADAKRIKRILVGGGKWKMSRPITSNGPRRHYLIRIEDGE